MNRTDELFKEDIIKIFKEGFKDENPRPHYADGTPAHTISINQQMRIYDLSNEFPILTLRPIAWKTGIKEILAIFQKQTNNLEKFHELGINYWDDWDIGDGTIGFRYGHTVKRYELLDNLIKGLKEDPFGRRHIMDLWQEEEFIEETKGLKPCAFLTMWSVRKVEYLNQAPEMFLDMTLVQRSGDMMCASGAGCINEVQYAALQMMIAQVCGYKPGKFCHFVQNEQIYDRHEEQAKELARRWSVEGIPMLRLNPEIKDFYDFSIEDFTMEDYDVDKIKEQNPQLKFELGI